jgi:hypothetical protein
MRRSRLRSFADDLECAGPCTQHLARLEVHQNRVRPNAFRGPKCLLAIVALAHNFDYGFVLQQCSQSLSDHGVVIDQ